MTQYPSKRDRAQTSRPKLACATLLLATLLAGSPAIASSSGVVFTADEKGGSISRIDLASDRVSTVPVAIMPHNVQISSDGKQLFAVGMGMTMAGKTHGTNSGGKLVTLDAASLSGGAIAEIDVGPHPAHVVIDDDGKFAFVTDSEENAVLVIDLAKRDIAKRIATGAYPHGLRLSPDGRELYVANIKGGNVSVIDVAKRVEVARIDLGKSPVQVAFTPDGQRIFVSLNAENKVAVIDRATRRVVGKVPVGRNPVQVYSTPDGRQVYVANQGTEKNPDDTVTVVDVGSLQPVATLRTGKGAHGVVISDDGARAFISNIVDGTVSVIDTVTQKVVRNYAVGSGPNGITFRGGE